MKINHDLRFFLLLIIGMSDLIFMIHLFVPLTNQQGDLHNWATLMIEGLYFLPVAYYVARYFFEKEDKNQKDREEERKKEQDQLIHSLTNIFDNIMVLYPIVERQFDAVHNNIKAPLKPNPQLMILELDQSIEMFQKSVQSGINYLNMEFHQDTINFYMQWFKIIYYLTNENIKLIADDLPKRRGLYAIIKVLINQMSMFEISDSFIDTIVMNRVKVWKDDLESIDEYLFSQ